MVHSPCDPATSGLPAPAPDRRCARHCFAGTNACECELPASVTPAEEPVLLLYILQSHRDKAGEDTTTLCEASPLQNTLF